MLELILRIALDPALASYAGAALAGEPALGSTLLRICERESGCTLQGHHGIDAWRSRLVWADSVRAGVLEPVGCRWHTLSAGPWSTSGPWGMMRGYAMRYLGCAPVWLLDVPIVGAIVAARRASSPVCARIRRCASWYRS
jgi:hypothetical protein